MTEAPSRFGASAGALAPNSSRPDPAWNDVRLTASSPRRVPIMRHRASRDRMWPLRPHLHRGTPTNQSWVDASIAPAGRGVVPHPGVQAPKSARPVASRHVPAMRAHRPVRAAHVFTDRHLEAPSRRGPACSHVEDGWSTRSFAMLLVSYP